MIGRIVVVAIIAALAVAIMVGTVPVIIIIIEITPAAIADAHGDGVVVAVLVLFFNPVPVLRFVGVFYRGIIHVIGGLTAFIRGEIGRATSELQSR